jgi:hypothetical protein
LVIAKEYSELLTKPEIEEIAKFIAQEHRDIAKTGS